MGSMLMLAAVATVATVSGVEAAAAQVPTAQPPAAQPQAAPPERGVLAYPPAFFADAAPVNAYDMVIRLPGFTFDKGAAVRGLAGSGGNVLIDGQPPVSKNDSLDEILRRIPAAGVERIELIRGGAPGVDMEGRTVMANVVRRQGAGFRAVIAPGAYYVYDGRVLPGLRMEAQWRWPGGRSAELAQVLGTGHSINDEYGDGGRVRYNADGSVRLRSTVEADSYGSRIWTTGAFETPAAGGRLRLNGAFMLTPAEVEVYDTYVGAAAREYEFNDIDRRQIELGGRFSRPFGEALSLEAVGFQQFARQDIAVRFEGPGLTRQFRLDRDTAETVGRLHLRYGFRPAMTLEAGGEGAFNRLESETDLSLNGRPVPLPAANVEVRERRGEVFGRATWKPAPALTLEAGVRQEFSRVRSDGDVVLGKSLAFTKPRLAATWAPDSVSQLRLRVEREVGQLNFDDFVASPSGASTGTVVAGNPDLDPQQAWVAEVSYERRFWKAGAALITLRRFEIDDTVDRGPARDAAGAILRDPVTGRPIADRPDNIGKGRKDELTASLTVPLDRLGVRGGQLKGQATWRDTRVTDPITGRRREISAAHPVDWEAHYSQDLPALKSTIGVDVIGGFRERFFRLTEVETRKFSPWVFVYGEYKPQPDWVIRVELAGVTSRNFRRIREVYAAGVLDYTDVRSLEWDGSAYVRVRKSFGR